MRDCPELHLSQKSHSMMPKPMEGKTILFISLHMHENNRIQRHD